ncbi:unnamed protein product [Chrysoparadoxa australica]
MKKVSTGQKVDIKDIRRGIDRMMYTSQEAEIASEQLFVEELMDITPSSSYEEESSWRDGYHYDRCKNVLGRSPVAGSGGQSGTAHAHAPNGSTPLNGLDGSQSVATSGMGGSSGDEGELFIRQEVPDMAKLREKSAEASLLSGALAAAADADKNSPKLQEQDRNDPLALSLGEDIVSVRPRSGASWTTSVYSEELSSADTQHDLCSGNLSARQLIAALLKRCIPLDPSLNGLPEEYDLKIADEGTEEPDTDFPELDGSAAIIDVGVDQFVLCPRGVTRALLVVKVQHVRGGGEGKLATARGEGSEGCGDSLEVQARLTQSMAKGNKGSSEKHPVHLSFPASGGPRQNPMWRYSPEGDGKF